MPGLIKPMTIKAGTERIIEINGKKQKQRFYYVGFDTGINYGDYTANGVILDEVWASGNAGYPPYNFYTKYNYKFLNKIIYQPSSDVYVTGLPIPIFYSGKKGNKKYILNKPEYYINWFSEYTYENEDVGDYIDSLNPGTFFQIWTESSRYLGYFVMGGWANYQTEENTPQNNTSQPPIALDKDWTLDEAKNKVKEMQDWADTNYLPPIFGLTNCVYFASNLGDTKPDDLGSIQNPIIKGYPATGSTIQYTDKTVETLNMYGMNYPMSSDFQLIKGKKDDVIAITSLFPYFNNIYDRFEIESDNTAAESNDDFEDNRQTFRKQSKKVKEYFLNQVVYLRFIPPDKAADETLQGNAKFNDYIVSAIITSVSLPKTDTGLEKGSITVKILTDLNLSVKDYFNARVVLLGNEDCNNYVQNETYSIKRYYKKDLGIGPRLGGSIMFTGSNSEEGEYDFRQLNGSYYFSSVLKDEERLNKPYKDVTVESRFNNITINHTFTKDDFTGVFNETGLDFNPDAGIIYPIEIPEKQYINLYPNYLIKNIDKRDYESYQNLKKASGLSEDCVELFTKGYSHNFIPNYVYRTPNINPKLKFGIYT